MRISQRDNKEYIYDIIRKKEVVLTPEEWVRQQLIHYLINSKSYPASLFSVEKQLKIGTLKKRYDLVVYRQDQPWLIVECKTESEKLSDETLRQVLAYNSQVQASYLAITNGKESRIYDVAAASWQSSYPSYK